MKNHQLSNLNQIRAGERGNITLVVVLFMGLAALTTLGVMTARRYSESRNIDNSITGVVEKWKARAEVNTLSQIVSRDASRQFLIDLQKARTDCRTSSQLKLFDDLNAASVAPAATFNGTELQCANQPSPSSVFGSVSLWITARQPMFEKTGRDLFGLKDENTKIIELKEIYRRSYANDTAYALRFVVESKINNYRTRANGEVILGTTAPICRTAGTLSASPTTVARGSSFNFSGNWSYAARVRIFNSAGAAIGDYPLNEQAAAIGTTISYTPAQTDTYYALYEGSGGCNVATAPITVTVTEPPPPPVCPVIDSFISTPNPVTSGGTYTISWSVSNAVSVTIDGASRPASGTRTYGGLSSARTFTLVAQSQSGTCNQTQNLTVNVQAPSCPYAMPTINNFSGSPTQIRAGQTINLSWNVSGLESSGEVRILGSGYNQAFGASGSTVVAPPETATGTSFYYTLQATNVCPDGNRLTITRDFAYQIVACPPPSIDAFSVSPNVVTVGGGQIIRFSWSVGGTADAVSIDNGIGGGLPASDSVDVAQPNATTTYTLTSVGCGVTRQSQITVTANNPPLPPVSARCTADSGEAQLINPDSGNILFSPTAVVSVERNASNPSTLDIGIGWANLNENPFPDASLMSMSMFINIPGTSGVAVTARGPYGNNPSGGDPRRFTPPYTYSASSAEAYNGGMTINIPWDGTPINEISFGGSYQGQTYASSGSYERLDMSGNFSGYKTCP